LADPLENATVEDFLLIIGKLYMSVLFLTRRLEQAEQKISELLDSRAKETKGGDSVNN
jgi:hypothetical protein